MLLTLASLAGHPRPSAPQRAAFVTHLAARHSWYKHLSFVERAPFVVFLAEPASTAEAEMFGHLAYAWQIPDQGDARWCWDRSDAIEVAPEVFACAGFALGPFISLDDNAAEVIVEEWGPAARRDGTGYRAPQHARLDAETRDRIDAIARARQRWEEAYARLDSRQRELVLDPPRLDDPEAVSRFREVDGAARALYASYQREEVRHVDDAIMRLLARRASLG